MTNDPLWAGGPFADAYRERNLNAGTDRGPFWDAMLKSLRYGAMPILEVGVNVGANLQHFPDDSYGCDVSADALAVARMRYPKMQLDRASVAMRLPYPSEKFTLVVSCGLLIHIAPGDIRRAVREVFRVSARYVLLLEYAAETETVVEYRGERAALWKRNWYDEVMRSVVGWQLTWTCPLGSEQGFDNVTAYLWEKS